jgi:hypothetical protein
MSIGGPTPEGDSAIADFLQSHIVGHSTRHFFGACMFYAMSDTRSNIGASILLAPPFLLILVGYALAGT